METMRESGIGGLVAGIPVGLPGLSLALVARFLVQKLTASQVVKGPPSLI